MIRYKFGKSLIRQQSRSFPKILFLFSRYEQISNCKKTKRKVNILAGNRRQKPASIRENVTKRLYKSGAVLRTAFYTGLWRHIHEEQTSFLDRLGSVRRGRRSRGGGRRVLLNVPRTCARPRIGTESAIESAIWMRTGTWSARGYAPASLLPRCSGRRTAG